MNAADSPSNSSKAKFYSQKFHLFDRQIFLLILFFASLTLFGFIDLIQNAHPLSTWLEPLPHPLLNSTEFQQTDQN